MRSPLSTTGRSTAYKFGIIVISMLLGLGIALVGIRISDGAVVSSTSKLGPCDNVRPRPSHMSCKYHYGAYSHASNRQTYPRHFRYLAKRAYRAWAHNHPSKAVLTPAAWWQHWSADLDDCIAYFAARSRCPARGVQDNKVWMNKVEDVTLTCGSGALAAFFIAGGPVDPPGAAAATIGTGGVCFFQFIVHWGIWG